MQKKLFGLMPAIAIIAYMSYSIIAFREQEPETITVPEGPSSEDMKLICREYFGGKETPTIPPGNRTPWHKNRVEEFETQFLILNKGIDSLHREFNQEKIDFLKWLEEFKAEIETQRLFQHAEPEADLRTFLRTHPKIQKNFEDASEKKQGEIRQLILTVASALIEAKSQFLKIQTHRKATNQKEEMFYDCLDARNATRKILQKHYQFQITEHALNMLLTLPENETGIFPDHLPEKDLMPILRGYAENFTACLGVSCPDEMLDDIKTDDPKKMLHLCILFMNLTEHERCVKKHLLEM